MDQYLMEGRYYQFVGRIREWIGTVAHDELEMKVVMQDYLSGGITELPLQETQLRGREVTSH